MPECKLQACRQGCHLLLPAVLYLVDHANSCIYMERVEGHSLKTLLRDDRLKDAGTMHDTI